MSPLLIQRLIATVFLILGGWSLAAPGMVLELSLRPEYQTDAPIAPILMGCFGAQAILAGLFAFFSRFTRATFAAYAVALLPFFFFDWWFYAAKPVFTPVILLDAVGNLIMFALCVMGWQRTKELTSGRA